MLVLLPILLAVTVIGFALPALFLWLSARWLKAPRAGFGQALAATAILSVLSIPFYAAHFLLAGRLAIQNGVLFILLAEAVLLLFQLFITWKLIARIFDTSFPRAIFIWGLYVIPTVVLSLGTLVLLKAFVTEAFVVPTNAMAPTIVGWHREQVCPHCRGTLIVGAQAPDDHFRMPEELDRPGICVACRKISEKTKNDSPVLSPDRILVSKLHAPERWDVVVFRYPERPESKWVMRLVGLPGETLVIKDGAVWINDKKMDVPADLAGLEYSIEDEFAHRFGAPKTPLRLGPDEYAVLGDFTKSANDSRYWGAVPGGIIEGVVALRYWPPERWKALR